MWDWLVDLLKEEGREKERKKERKRERKKVKKKGSKEGTDKLMYAVSPFTHLFVKNIRKERATSVVAIQISSDMVPHQRHKPEKIDYFCPICIKFKSKITCITCWQI